MKMWMKVAGVGSLAAGALVLSAWVGDREVHSSTKSETGGFGPREVWHSSRPLAGLAKVERSPETYSPKMDLSLEPKTPEPPTPALPANAQMLIRSGTISLEVAQFNEAARELARIAQEAGGYLADTRQERRASGTYAGEVTLRIPAERYDGSEGSIRRLGKVLGESSQVQDVTKAFMDVEAKLAVRSAAFFRVKDLLRTRAGTLKEVLEAEKELSRLQEEIEELEGERRFYRHQVRLTTLQVELAEPEALSLSRPSHWSPLRNAASDIAFLLAGSLAALLRLFVVILPWTLLGGVAFLIIRRTRIKPVVP